MIKINKNIGFIPVNFNPEYYKKAVKSYREGSYREMIALIEQAEIDSHVSGCLDGRHDGYKRDWRVTEVSESAQDLSLKEFVEGVFLNINMRDLFEDIFDAKLKGYSVIDLNWDISEGKQIITNPAKLHQKYFRRDIKDGKLKIDFGKELREIPKDAALVCEYKKNPVLLSVLRDYILKEFGLESWAGFIEVFGESFILGKYPPGSDDKFKKEVEDAVNRLGMASRGVAPIGTELEIIETKRSAGDHELFVDRADKGISITILGHENAVSDTSGMKIGENLAPFKVARSKAVSDIYFIEEYIYKLVKTLIDRNFPGVKKYPVFSIDKSEPIDIKERLSVIDSAYEKGYKIHPDEFAKLGLYKFDDQEPLQKQAAANLLD